jgi:two-component system response regulator
MLNIVLVDDDALEHYLIKQAIKRTGLGCDVTSVYNGLQLMDYLLRREAYKKINDPLPDLIFLDVHMPLLDGIGVLHEIHENERLQKIPVYMLSSQSDADSKRKCLALGAADYIVKPMDQQDLTETFQAICQKHLSEHS